MFGIQAINHYHGWSMALAGVLIVFSGLFVLSIAVSQIHKLLLLWEKRSVYLKMLTDKGKAGTEEELSLPARFPVNPREAAYYYQPLIFELGESFLLTDLHALARKKGLPHPHLTIRDLQQAGFLIPQKDGVFFWNPSGEADRKEEE